MRARSRPACALPRLLALPLALVAFGCASATYVQVKVTEDPLERVAQEARADWSVQRDGATRLRLSDAWPIHSVFALGYSSSHANLAYDASDSMLEIQYYFRSHQLPLLFIPFYLDAEPGFVGGALKPIMNEQVGDILRWSGGTVVSRRSGHRSAPAPVEPSSPGSTGAP